MFILSLLFQDSLHCFIGRKVHSLPPELIKTKLYLNFTIYEVQPYKVFVFSTPRSGLDISTYLRKKAEGIKITHFPLGSESVFLFKPDHLAYCTIYLNFIIAV